ncbi:MAG: hypothetical protein RML32_04155 [Gammaproteobacteria bacterium]|nr:hypothetical protein [Gammaproteobacteria bacterium]
MYKQIMYGNRAGRPPRSLSIHALTQGDAAELLGVTAQTIRRWETDGSGLPRNEDGTYSGPRLVAWALGRERASRGVETLDPEQERARKDKEQADKIALQNAQTRGELLKRSDVIAQVGAMLASFRARVLVLPEVVGQIVDAATAHRVVPIVRDRVYEALAEIAEYEPRVSAHFGEGNGSAAEDDGLGVGGQASEALEGSER